MAKIQATTETKDGAKPESNGNAPDPKAATDALPDEDVRIRQDETIIGGAYIVDGELVNADGKPIG